LDLFCGAGGAAMGYNRAGFDVVGVDIRPQPNYPFEFVQADALEWVASAIRSPGSTPGAPSERRHGGRWRSLPFHAIHASPPCPRYSNITHTSGDRDNHPDLIAPTRELLDATSLPYVIENVEGSPLHDPVMLCGTMWDPPLDGLKRHRLFETNWVLQPPMWPCRHKLAAPRFRVYEHGKWYLSPFVKVYGLGGGKAMEHWNDAMGVNWMTPRELKDAIPPAYTEFIGAQLLEHIAARAAA
jgi:DNA (cytosine-5)-methyltransferase 1